MKKIVLILAISLALFGCKRINGSGKIVEKEIHIEDVEYVDLSGSGKVNITFGETEALTVIGDDNIIEAMDIEVKGGKLRLGSYKNKFTSVSPSQNIQFNLTLKSLNGMGVSGSGELESESVKADDFKISISGSGEVTMDGLETGSLKLNISGSGNCAIRSGSVDKQNIRISGSGEYHAKNLSSKEADCQISGSGDADLMVSEFINADISGSGSIRYWGNARTSLDASGSGSIRNMD